MKQRFGFVGALARKYQPPVLTALNQAIQMAKDGLKSAAEIFAARARKIYCFREVWYSETKVFLAISDEQVLIADFSA